MKLISRFHNKYNNITYCIYILPNGTQLLHLQNPATIDFDFSVVINAGCAYEDGEKVPRGTAHFLEHMFFNPNSTFKTKAAIDKYEEGDVTRPAIYTNGMTTRKYMYLYSHGNEHAEDRILKRVGSLIDFSEEVIKKYFKKEKEIILAERSRKPKVEKDPFIQNLEFLFKGSAKEFTYNIIGEPEDINKIEIKDLERYFKNRFNTGNIVFAIQSKEELSKKTQRYLENIDSSLPNKSHSSSFRDFDLKNRWDIGTFYDERATGTTLSAIYIHPVAKSIDYKEEALLNIFNKLIDKIGFDYLREKLGLVYGINSFLSYGFAFNYFSNGFRLVCENGKLEKLLESLDYLLYKESFVFLKSPKGERWLKSCISEVVFPRAIKFDPDIAEGSSTMLQEVGEIFNANIYSEECKKIKIKDVIKYFKKMLSIPPRIWIESDLKEDYLKKVIQKSTFGERWNK